MSNRIARRLLGIIVACTGLLEGQPAQGQPEFEVASIKPNTANDRIVTINVGPGGRFAARGYTLVLLMQRAYGVMDWNVSGGPGWIRSDRWDVVAKANVAGNLTERQLQPRLEALLADRFKLKLHREPKEIAGYALVVGRRGPKLGRRGYGEENRDSFRWNSGELGGEAISMATLARFVGGKLGLVVVDKTGLEGVYDFTAKWTEETNQPGVDPQEARRMAVSGALEDQLGLKITPQKITVQMLVIDRAEKATEN